MAAPTVFGTTKEGHPVEQWEISNGPLSIKVINFGATITSVLAPDATGTPGEITLGFEELTPYTDGRSPYFGCVAGRVANRIGKGKFALDGTTYSLATNNGPSLWLQSNPQPGPLSQPRPRFYPRPTHHARTNLSAFGCTDHLHGGLVGFDKQVWSCEARSETSLTLALISPDGAEGYPGAVAARVTYSLPSPTQLKIEYSATTDAPTPLNLTNHTYWNLADGGASSVLAHEIELAADFYTPVDDTSIPTGEVRALSGAMDLRQRGRVGRSIADADQGMGYDHNYVLRALDAVDGLRPVARVWEPASGRWVAVRTDQPGVQYYTGNYLDGVAGRGSTSYGKHHGFCLETQRFPDSVNRPHFPSAILRPGEVYTHTTVHQFGASRTPPEGPY